MISFFLGRKQFKELSKSSKILVTLVAAVLLVDTGLGLWVTMQELFGPIKPATALVKAAGRGAFIAMLAWGWLKLREARSKFRWPVAILFGLYTLWTLIRWIYYFEGVRRGEW